MTRGVLEGDGPFAGMSIDKVLCVFIECYVMMPLRQMLACGEDAYFIRVDEDPNIIGLATHIEGEDDVVTAAWMDSSEPGTLVVRGCWAHLDKWDALVPRSTTP